MQLAADGGTFTWGIEEESMRGRWWLGVASLLMGCGEAEPARPVEESKADPGVAAFWDAFYAGDVARAEEVGALLDTDIERQPEAFYPTFLRGLTDFWWLAESGRHGTLAPGDAAEVSFRALDAMERAWELAPGDDRLYGWHGGLLTAMGRATGSEELTARGLDELALGSELHPSIALFTTFGLFESAPAGSPDFARAVDAFWALADRCVAGGLDRHNPDMAPHVDALAEPYCGNLSITPHNWEGFWSRAGDLLLKNGEPDVARVLYANARLQDLETWPFRDLLDEKVATLAERGALYADGDPGNDPPLGAETAFCATCHAHE
jgi:hypothetical protein